MNGNAAAMRAGSAAGDKVGLHRGIDGRGQTQISN